MMGMTAAEEEAAKKQYRKSRKSFTNKQCLALMKSMSKKGVFTSPQKSQKGLFQVIQTRWFDQWSTWKVIVY
jgi:hypothetical protein